MDYNQIKLSGFTKYLLEKDAELSERVQPLGITDDGLLSSMSGEKSSQEDWDKTIEYWEEYKSKMLLP